MSAATVTAFRRVVAESTWRAAMPADVAARLPATARPFEEPAGTPRAPADVEGAGGPQGDDDLANRLAVAGRLLADGWLRIHGTAARGTAGVTFAVASDLSAAAGVVRRTGPGAEAQLALAPDPEVALLPAAQLVDELLRLLPARAEAAAPARPDAVPITCRPEVAATLVRALREDDTRLVRGVCAQLGVDEPPALLRSLVTLRGEYSLLLSAPGGPSRALRLLLGTDGWVETSLRPDGVHHRRVGLDQLRALLTDEIAGAADRAVRAADRG